LTSGEPVKNYAQLMEYLLSLMLFCQPCHGSEGVTAPVQSREIARSGDAVATLSLVDDSGQPLQQQLGLHDNLAGPERQLHPAQFGCVELDFDGKNLLVFYIPAGFRLERPDALYRPAAHIVRGPAGPDQWSRLTDGHSFHSGAVQ
jgi:hypothetical protein